MARQVKVRETRVVSDEYGVSKLEVSGEGRHLARKTPCEQCPWRTDVPTGVFPALAYVESAPTAYDMADETFSCHMAGAEHPATCAGFLLRHSYHNLSVRLALIGMRLDLSKITDGGFPLYRSYREMAIANGVDPEDPVLAPVRGDDD